MTEKFTERFWSKCRTSDPDGCWEWTAAMFHDGYGMTSVRSKAARSHRVAWRIVNGDIPDGLHVCHACDNRKCCNPSHLFLGTAKENQADCIQKDRSPRGERHGGARLTETGVMKIIHELAAGRTQRAIAKEVGIDKTIVSRIWLGKNWKHLARPWLAIAGAQT